MNFFDLIIEEGCFYSCFSIQWMRGTNAIIHSWDQWLIFIVKIQWLVIPIYFCSWLMLLHVAIISTLPIAYLLYLILFLCSLGVCNYFCFVVQFCTWLMHVWRGGFCTCLSCFWSQIWLVGWFCSEFLF